MKLAIVCPLGRKETQQLVVSLVRQTVQDFALIVVENGLGIGASISGKLRPRALIKSDKRSPGAARNLGIDVARVLGMTHVACFDDDDLYAPGYLAEVIAAFEAGHPVVGKHAHFTKLASGNVVLRNSGDIGDVICNREVTTVPGCTLAFELRDDLPRFDEELRVGEDTKWCADWVAQGNKVWATSPFHFCYLRHGYHHGHTYPARDRHLLAFSRGETYDVGAQGGSALRLIESGDMDLLRARAVRREPVTLTKAEEEDFDRLMSGPPPVAPDPWDRADGPSPGYCPAVYSPGYSCTRKFGHEGEHVTVDGAGWVDR